MSLLVRCRQASSARQDAIRIPIRKNGLRIRLSTGTRRPVPIPTRRARQAIIRTKTTTESAMCAATRWKLYTSILMRTAGRATKRGTGTPQPASIRAKRAALRRIRTGTTTESAMCAAIRWSPSTSILMLTAGRATKRALARRNL